jgi:hypothetical protein
MDLMAETVVITPSVKQTAPPIRMADPLVDLLALPSYNMNRPAKSRAAERTTSKKVEILRMVVFPGGINFGCGSKRVQKVERRDYANQRR